MTIYGRRVVVISRDEFWLLQFWKRPQDVRKADEQRTEDKATCPAHPSEP